MDKLVFENMVSCIFVHFELHLLVERFRLYFCIGTKPEISCAIHEHVLSLNEKEVAQTGDEAESNQENFQECEVKQIINNLKIIFIRFQHFVHKRSYHYG